MARGRMIPTNLFSDEHYIDLSNDQVRQLLLAMVLASDDYGRGKSHYQIINSLMHWSHPQELIAEMVAELERSGFLELYEQEERHYYFVCPWYEWQTLSHPTPSRLPIPPSQKNQPPYQPKGKKKSPEKPRETQGNTRLEEEVESESERESKPITSVVVEETRDGDNGAKYSSQSQPERGTTGEGTITHLVDQVAGALKIPVHDELLVTLVRDYTTQHPQISLVSEAHTARLWINGPKNTNKKQMSSVFFKSWLDRERRSCTPVPPAHADTGGAKETPPNQYTARSLDPEHNKQQLEKLRLAVEQQRAREAASHG